jgi:glyoxylase-like metal-dependent hydrolase (beta-lactamase superfamily II)
MSRLEMTLRAALFAAAGLTLANAASAQPMVGAPARPVLAPQPPELPPGPLPKDSPSSPFTIFPIRGGLYMIVGPGGNTTVSIGHDGILVVDPSTAAAAPGLLAQIRRLSSGAIHNVVDTNGDLDHAGGNEAVSNAGVLLEGGNTRPPGYGEGGAPIWAHENVQKRLTENGVQAGFPTDTYFVAQKDMFVNGEPVQLFHTPSAHTDGDSLVMFRRSDVIAAGDLFTPDRYPMVDLDHGGSIDGLIDGLNMLIRLTVPEFNEEGGTYVVPGHGRLSDESDIAEYRDMVTIIRDRVQDMIRRRMSLAQVKAAKPTLDYDPEFGADAGQTFTEVVYKSLTAQKAAAAKGARK